MNGIGGRFAAFGIKFDVSQCNFKFRESLGQRGLKFFFLMEDLYSLIFLFLALFLGSFLLLWRKNLFYLSTNPAGMRPLTNHSRNQRKKRANRPSSPRQNQKRRLIIKLPGIRITTNPLESMDIEQTGREKQPSAQTRQGPIRNHGGNTKSGNGRPGQRRPKPKSTTVPLSEPSSSPLATNLGKKNLEAPSLALNQEPSQSSDSPRPQTSAHPIQAAPEMGIQEGSVSRHSPLAPSKEVPRHSSLL